MSEEDNPLEHTPQEGYLYESAYDTVYQIKFIDDHVVLLVYENRRRERPYAHRVETRNQFDEMVESGRFEHLPNAEDITKQEEVDWEDVPHVGQKTNEKLIEAGFETCEDIDAVSEEELIDVDSVGGTAAENLKKYCK